MARNMFFIDGFNVYHSLKCNPAYHKYLWLDFRTLAERFTKKRDTIVGVYYFTAYATWKPFSMERHKALISALKSRGVKFVLGKFKLTEKYCKNCETGFLAREEKQTDVNIAVNLFKKAHDDNYDQAILITSDSDLVPAIKAVRQSFPKKRVQILFPIDRWSQELQSVCNTWRKIERKDLSQSQFPEEVMLSSGIVLTRPQTWK
ncbi:MAG: NYN domain-containing protein [Deltaproteobacteria bacterium]|nr:NYN domain-containing protein [Deltaproteobacteria bacterium]